ncbi:hypothetical protein EC843_102519 [Buttiauxella sp. JUb87]|nr:hypothetical protein EC843_102519 [Buttiauxella sp. JUb87]
MSICVALIHYGAMLSYLLSTYSAIKVRLAYYVAHYQVQT